jgi:hypothetical protein
MDIININIHLFLVINFTIEILVYKPLMLKKFSPIVSIIIPFLQRRKLFKRVD